MAGCGSICIDNLAIFLAIKLAKNWQFYDILVESQAPQGLPHWEEINCEPCRPARWRADLMFDRDEIALLALLPAVSFAGQGRPHCVDT